jgi:hypothetical protein
MKTIALLFSLLLICLCSPVFAIDLGTASGSITIGQDTIELKHSYAHLHDNAEGWLDTPKELRILVTDRAVSKDVIAGMNPFFTLSEMVREGKIKGALIRLDPSAPKSIVLTLLTPPKDERNSLGNKTFSDSTKSPIDSFTISNVRVSGSFQQAAESNPDMGWPAENYTFTFSAPIFNEPAVSATLKGKKALDSRQTKAVLAVASAMMEGDTEKVRKLSTERKNRQMSQSLAQLPPENMKTMLQEAGSQMEQTIKKGTLTLIVRGSTASLLVRGKASGKSMFRVVQKNRGWLVD